MGFPWRKLAQVGVGIGSIFVPGLANAIQVVEESAPALKGPDKKAAAVAMASVFVSTIEGAASKDLLDDAKVVEATSRFVDAYVSVENAKAELLAALEAAKAAKN